MIWRLVSNFAMELSRPYRKATQEFDAARKGNCLSKCIVYRILPQIEYFQIVDNVGKELHILTANSDGWQTCTFRQLLLSLIVTDTVNAMCNG